MKTVAVYVFLVAVFTQSINGQDQQIALDGFRNHLSVSCSILWACRVYIYVY